MHLHTIDSSGSFVFSTMAYVNIWREDYEEMMVLLLHPYHVEEWKAHRKYLLKQNSNFRPLLKISPENMNAVGVITSEEDFNKLPAHFNGMPNQLHGQALLDHMERMTLNS